MPFEIDVVNQVDASVDVGALRTALIHGLNQEHVARAVLSVTIVDNDEIHRINREFLSHDYPTDVISFQLDWRSSSGASPGSGPMGRSAGAEVEGEIIVSIEYAAEMSAGAGWSIENELTLYAVHGMLHICGYDDLVAAEKEIMRAREIAVLSGLGLVPVYPVEQADRCEHPASAPSPERTPGDHQQ